MTQETKDVVTKALKAQFESDELTVFGGESLIYAARDLGLDDLASEMTVTLKNVLHEIPLL